jgi:hypothetical protein
MVVLGIELVNISNAIGSYSEIERQQGFYKALLGTGRAI